ncbi:MAG: phosphodiester glycosidase family protein [Alistipes sp.]
MSRQILAGLCALLCFCTLASCKGDDAEQLTFPKEDSDASLTGYPQGMRVTHFIQDLGNGNKCKGYLVEVDFAANPKLQFNAYHTTQAKTPTEIFAELSATGKNKPYIVTNGGYFWDGQSLSLLISAGKMQALAAQIDYNQTVAQTYPIRGAFGQLSTGQFETHWIYCVADDHNKPYAFPSPLGNDARSQTYLPTPPTSATAGASLWEPVEAIGGGPILIHNGKNVWEDSYWRELLEAGGTGGTSRQPRTAIGATATGKLIVIVCDGRGQDGSVGMTLGELTDKFIAAGAVNAVNLDGGGSSVMIDREGSILSHPSDASGQRSVPTAIVISEK